MTEEIDTTNRFVVAGQGEDLVFLLPVPQRITREDALLLAAYLVALADHENRFQAVLHAVMNT